MASTERLLYVAVSVKTSNLFSNQRKRVLTRPNTDTVYLFIFSSRSSSSIGDCEAKNRIGYDSIGVVLDPHAAMATIGKNSINAKLVSQTLRFPFFCALFSRLKPGSPSSEGLARRHGRREVKPRSSVRQGPIR